MTLLADLPVGTLFMVKKSDIVYRKQSYVNASIGTCSCSYFKVSARNGVLKRRMLYKQISGKCEVIKHTPTHKTLFPNHLHV